MFVEIEAKLRVDSLERVEQRLAQIGASGRSNLIQTDWYFDDPDRTLTATDQCLRLRREQTADGCKLVLTYKGPKQKADYKKRQEVNLEVSDEVAAVRLLEAMGYGKMLAFDKRRRSWDVNDCEVALDELPLIGSFVEIEGPDAPRIAAVQASLALTDAVHVTDSYASLIEERLGQLGLAQREVFL